MVRVMVFNATFNNSSAISLRSALLVEETGVPGKDHRPVLVTDKFYHISSTPRHEGVRTYNVGGDRHYQLPYDHGHDGPTIE